MECQPGRLPFKHDAVRRFALFENEWNKYRMPERKRTKKTENETKVVTIDNEVTVHE